MPVIIQTESKPKVRAKKAILRWELLSGELGLFLSVTIARFIVWLALRRRHQERAARRKRFRLLQGGDRHAGQGAVRS